VRAKGLEKGGSGGGEWGKVEEGENTGRGPTPKNAEDARKDALSLYAASILLYCTSRCSFHHSLFVFSAPFHSLKPTRLTAVLSSATLSSSTI
jgi:hypothetical protein